MSETVTCCREWERTVDLFGHPVIRYADDGGTHATLPLDEGPVHCTWCGARFSVRADGTVELGPSQDRLLAALHAELADGAHDCPMYYTAWQCTATPETHDCEMGLVELCWLLYFGLAATYAEAQELWARMEEAANSDG